MSSTTVTRRQMLVGGVAALGATAVGSRRVMGANDRIRVGFIGCGQHGTYLLERAGTLSPDLVDVTAVCDVWRPNRERAAARVRGLFGVSPRQYTRYAEMLALDSVDAVVIATPDFAHCRMLRDAVGARKDAFVEKPLGIDAADVHATVEAVERSGRVVAMGTQRRSSSRHQAAVSLVRGGALGQVSMVRASWYDAAPTWSRAYDDVKPEDVDWAQFLMGLPDRPFDPRRLRCWQLFRDYTIGVAGLLWSHGIDLACWYLDDPLPRSAVGHGGTFVWKDGRETVDTIEAMVTYPKGWHLSYGSVLWNKRQEPDFLIRGAQGVFDTNSWTLRAEGGRVMAGTGALYVEDRPAADHLRNWLLCVRDRRQPNATIRDGLAHSLAGIMAQGAVDSGRRHRYDPDTRAITIEQLEGSK